MMRISYILAGTVLAATPVMAQQQPAPTTQSDTVQTDSLPPAQPPQKSILDGNYLTLGGGAIYGPSYEGSKHYVIFPIPAIQGRIGGVAINPRAGGVALDLIADPKGAKIGFALGPVATYSANRARHIVDPVVAAAGGLDANIAVGVSTGATLYRLLDKYDSITATADVKWDIHGATGGLEVSPALTYLTPLSKSTLLTLTGSAKHVNYHYANYYYSVSEAQSEASGLPLFQGRGGWASAGGTMIIGHSLTGDLRKAGITIVAIGGYSRLFNSARENPYTSIRGSATQFTGGLGAAVTF